jgi:hypothetical protein
MQTDESQTHAVREIAAADVECTVQRSTRPEREERMQRKLVTCPDSAHLEEIEYEETSCGMVITACSRYAHGEIRCARECAARLDRRARTTTAERVTDDSPTKKTSIG